MRPNWARRTLSAIRMSLSGQAPEPTDDDVIIGSLGSTTAALMQTPDALAAGKRPCTISQRIEDLSFTNGALLQQIDHLKRRLSTIEPHLPRFQQLGEACGNIVEEFSKALADLDQEIAQEKEERGEQYLVRQSTLQHSTSAKQ